MKVTVRSREGAIVYPYDPNTILISIESPLATYSREIPDHPNIVEKLTLKFHDIEEVLKDTDGNVYNPMSVEQAHEIVEFVGKHYNNIENIVVHCDAGISRSSGVAGAILKHYFGDDSQIFDNPRYMPNMHCYRLVLDAFDIYYKEIH